MHANGAIDPGRRKPRRGEGQRAWHGRAGSAYSASLSELAPGSREEAPDCTPLLRADTLSEDPPDEAGGGARGLARTRSITARSRGLVDRSLSRTEDPPGEAASGARVRCAAERNADAASADAGDAGGEARAAAGAAPGEVSGEAGADAAAAEAALAAMAFRCFASTLRALAEPGDSTVESSGLRGGRPEACGCVAG